MFIDFQKFKISDYYLVLVFVTALQLLLGFQGFDVCDDGFVLTSFQQIFNNPESIEYNFVYYLSVLVGGLWYELFPSGGIIWFRLLTTIVNSLCFVLAYQIFKNFIPKRIVLLGLTMVLFVNDFGFLTFYHNHLTVLLLLCSVWFQLQALQRNKLLFLLVSGFFIGINVFTRIPNITLFSFVLSIPFYFYLNGKHLKRSIKPILVYLFGICIGLLTILLVMYQFKHLYIFQNAISSLVNVGSVEGSSHNLGSLVYIYLDNYKLLFKFFAELVVIVTLFVLLKISLKSYKILSNVLFVFGLLAAFIWFKNTNIFIAYTASYIGVLFVAFTRCNTIGTRTLAFLGFLMLLVLPLGSGGGISSSGYMCIWLSLPFFFHVLLQIEAREIKFLSYFNLKFPKFIFIHIAVLFSILFLSAKGYHLSKQAYFDYGSRLKKTHTINSRFTKYIYTKKRRARIVNDLLSELNKWVEPKDYLLVYDKVPMIHFLTDTKPYLYNPWVWIYDSQTFGNKLNKAESEISIYPIIVQQKMETIYAFSEPIENYMTSKKEEVTLQFNGYDAERNRLMTNFIDRNSYEIVWSNDYFNIYKTEKYNNTFSK